MVEFALVAPLFFMLLFGVIEMGRLVWTNHELTNGTREGARFAMVHGSEASSQATLSQIEARILATTAGIQDSQLSVSATGLGGAPGTKVVITSTYQYEVALGMIPGLSDMTLTHRSEVTIQH
jgi:Flp pilus assembly protein TadG